MKEKIKKYFGESLTIIGAGLFFYNIFNFSYRGGYGGERIKGSLPELTPRGLSVGRWEFEYVAYYYQPDVLLLISIGAMLIVGGILIIRNKSK
jgi:hypothetical protein